jgi:DNA-binding CsgD family transcriptional regulator
MLDTHENDSVSGGYRPDETSPRFPGHGEPGTQPSVRPRNPGGLSGRQVEVLRLAARGLTTRQIASRLDISTKTADHHIQHIYNKIGVSTRAAAALWATQHSVVG